MRHYGELNPGERLTPNQQRTLLQNAIYPINELCAVKNQADQFKTQTGNDLTFDEYLRLLNSAALSRDATMASRRQPLTKQRSMYESEQYDPYNYSYDVNTHKFSPDFADGESFSMDEPISTIQAYAARQQQHPPPQWQQQPKPAGSANSDRSGLLPKEVWSSLTPSDQCQWSSLPASLCAAGLRAPHLHIRLIFMNPLLMIILTSRMLKWRLQWNQM